MSRKVVLVTGCAGFIAFHLIQKLFNEFDVLGIDNLNNYYDVDLKLNRLKILKKSNNFIFEKEDIRNMEDIKEIFNSYHPDFVIHLAAEAGVRYSYEYPEKFIDTNLIGFYNILECCRKYKPMNFIYASSSSVYGNIEGRPSKENDNTDYPVSLYGATKKCNEILAHSYHKFFNIKMTGLRFYTVWGPYGRPDMAISIFSDAIMNNKKIQINNFGNMERDFTYVGDIVNGIYLSMLNSQDYKIYNLGSGTTVNLKHFVELLEKAFNQTVEKEYVPLPPGDVLMSMADISLAKKELGYVPQTQIETNIIEYVNWYKEYYGTKQ